ncbi:MAG: hypothetical protein LBJ90_01545 [Treponema sp.]|jgi:hypothetical protein|nr:hypothetical protein [Treponema sp.]
MKKPLLVFFAALFIFSAGILVGFGGKEREDKPGAEKSPILFRDRNGRRPERKEKTREEVEALETVRVTGRVRLVGSGIRTEIVITGSDGEWHLEPKDQEKFLNLQQRVVTVEGKLDTEEFALINSGKKIEWLILRDAALIRQ